MSRILLVGFSFQGSWHYARLAVIADTDGYTICIHLQDEDLQVLLAGHETLQASRQHLLLAHCPDATVQTLRSLIAGQAASLLNLDLYSPGNRSANEIR